MKTYFITATGTDIGKTVITAHLVREFARQGRKAQALKPIASGVDPARLGESDPGILLEAMGQDATPKSVGEICPWSFPEPLAPDQAAARSGRSIDFQALIDFCRKPRDGDILFVEGVGGVRVPIARTQTVAEWIRELKVPALVVSGTYLGSISHLLTALDGLDRAEVTVHGVILNRSVSEPMPVEEMSEALEPLIGSLPVTVFPRLSNPFEQARPGLAGPLRL